MLDIICCSILKEVGLGNMISFAIWILLGSLSTCLALNCHFIHAICDYLQASTVVIHGAMDDGVYPDLLTCAANGLPVFIQVFSANEPGNRFQAKDKSIVHFVSRSDAHIGLVQRKYFLHHWFLPQDFDDGQLYLRQDSRVFKYKSNRTNKSISVSEIYAFKNQTRYQNHLGSFDQKSFSLPSPFSTEGVWSRRGNLKGATLQGVMAEYEIFNFKDDNGHYAGACVDIFKVMSNVANFSFKFIDAPDGSYGATKDGTTWGGIVGELMAGHADYGGALMGVSKERSDVIDYTLSIYQDMVTLHHFESGYQTQLNFKAYADVLHSWSWMAILCTLLVLDVALIFITCIHNHGHPFILDNSSLVFATLIQRDTPISIRTWSAKVLFYFACLFGLLIFSSYAALLTSTMIFSPGGIVLETLDDVIANGYDLLIWKDSFSHQIFIDSKPGTSFYNAYQHYFVEVWLTTERLETFFYNLRIIGLGGGLVHFKCVRGI